MIRSVRTNALDARLRELERRSQADPQARIRFFRALRQRGDFVEYVTGLLLRKFRGAIDEGRRDFEERPTEESAGLGPVIPGLTGAGIFVPDAFDRPYGLHLSAEVQTTRSKLTVWGIQRAAAAGRHISREEEEALPPSHRVDFTAALSQGEPLFPPLHPFHFWLYNQESYTARSEHPLESVPGPKPALPPRSERTTILVRDLDEEAFRWATADALDSLRQRLDLVDRQLTSAVRAMGGTVSLKGAQGAVQTAGTPDAAVSVLQAVPGPQLVSKEAPYLNLNTQAWNYAGTGMSHGAIVALARFLVRAQRAVPPEGPAGGWLSGDPFSREGGYFTSAGLKLTSRRAKRTRYPLVVYLRWDAVNNFWRDRGDAWIGNTMPPQGLWRIMAGGPSTVEDLGEATQNWVIHHFPRSVVEITWDKFAGPWEDKKFTRVWPKA